jgi:hypothetical protein
MLYGYGGFNVSLTPALALLMRCGWKTDVYAITKFKRWWWIWKKNGMMQELKCKTKCIWWFHCRGRPNSKIYFLRFSCHSWWVKWRFASRCNHDTASRIDESRFAGSGVMDMLRTALLPQAQVGLMIMEQHKTVKKCLNISRIFSVHNVKKGTHYPATMVTTGITMTVSSCA